MCISFVVVEMKLYSVPKAQWPHVPRYEREEEKEIHQRDHRVEPNDDDDNDNTNLTSGKFIK